LIGCITLVGLGPVDNPILVNAAAPSVFVHRDFSLKLSYPLARRQQQCLEDCSTISNALYCQDSACACPILTTASTSDITTCENCLDSNGYSSYSGFITLAYEVCTECSDQCSSVLTAAIGASEEDCTTLACYCPFLQSGGANALESCASCMQSFDSSEASNLLSFVTGCGFSNSASTSPTTTSPKSSPATEAQTTPTPGSSVSTEVPVAQVKPTTETTSTSVVEQVTTGASSTASSEATSDTTGTTSAQQHSSAQTLQGSKKMWWFTVLGMVAAIMSLH
jgi:peptidoglycan DL-endopeptidase CwlO